MLQNDQVNNTPSDDNINSTLDKLLVILSIIVIVVISPFFVWSNQLSIFRITHLIGNLILIYIIIRYHNMKIFNLGLALFFLVISIYTMIAGTEYKQFSYIPLLSALFIVLKPNEHLRIYYYFITILAIIFSIGLISYSLQLLGLNIQIGESYSTNPSKDSYAIYFGHVQESGLLGFDRFSSIFDEPGVVGTLSGLILCAIGVSKRNIKSIVFLLAGLVSFSLAFYVILIIYLFFTFNIKRIILISILLIPIIYLSGDLFNTLIADRLEIVNGRLVGDNRTTQQFDEYYNFFITKGGNDLIFGKGHVNSDTIEELWAAASYKLFLIRYGIIGLFLTFSFYALGVYSYYNSKKGWFLFIIFMISAYQRPDLLKLFSLVMFFGGLKYMKQMSIAVYDNV